MIGLDKQKIAIQDLHHAELHASFPNREKIILFFERMGRLRKAALSKVSMGD